MKITSKQLAWLSFGLVWAVLIWMWTGGEEGKWRGGAIKGTDLRQHELAGRLWNEGQRELLYRDHQFGKAFGPDDPQLERFNYVYSPFVAWTASWFDNWSRESRYLGWWLVSVAALAASIGLWTRAFPEEKLTASDWAYVFGCPSLFFILTAFQNTTLTLLAVVSGILLLRRGLPLAAGLALAGSLYKPSLAPYIGLMLLVAGHWKAVAGLVFGGICWIAACLACGGWDLTVLWAEALAGMLNGGQITNPKTNVSMVGFVETVGLPRPIGWILGIGTLGGCAYWLRLCPRPPEAAVFCGLLAWLLGASYVPHYEWLLGLPLLALHRAWLYSPGWTWWLLGLLAFASGIAAGVSMVAPACVLWLLVSWLFKKKAQPGA